MDPKLTELFDLFKAREIAPTLPTHDAEWFLGILQDAQEKAWTIGEACIVGSKEWFDAQPEVKF